ncbi:hypothetical protein F5Y06DRAFT_267967 [Hypoxylon sp. FL0890]|nr:hypothetical protein F5Y06DRAFT_267967 [Hypoxylon sp. FL0890]
MSQKFSSDSLRKRIKAVKAMISINDPEHPGMRLRRWKSNDSIANRRLTKGDENPANGKGVDTNHPDDHSNGLLKGHAPEDKDSSQLYRPDGSIKIKRRKEVVTRRRNLGGDSTTDESPKSITFMEDVLRAERTEATETQGGEPMSPTAPSVDTSASSIKTVNTFIDARSAFRAWSDKELKRQRQVIEKYETESKLWTKEELIAIEGKIKKQNPVVKIPAYVGEDHVFEKEKGVTYQVEFYGYQALAFPPSSRPDGMPYCSLSLKTKPFDYSEPRSHEVELAMFKKCRALWYSNPIGQNFYSTFMKLPLPPYINKIVCFDLGSITSKPADNYPHIRKAMYRHAAAMTIAECLHKRFGLTIKLFCQDTTYTNACVGVLYKKGFSVIGPHGAAGFAEIDDKTLVFAPNPSFCIKEIVADIAEPAAMFWNTVLSPEQSERVNKSTRPLEFDDKLSSYYFHHEADPDTPRVRNLTKNYVRHPFPMTNLFGAVSLYTRNGLSVCHVQGGYPEGQASIRQLA